MSTPTSRSEVLQNLICLQFEFLQIRMLHSNFVLPMAYQPVRPNLNFQNWTLQHQNLQKLEFAKYEFAELDHPSEICKNTSANSNFANSNFVLPIANHRVGRNLNMQNSYLQNCGRGAISTQGNAALNFANSNVLLPQPITQSGEI